MSGQDVTETMIDGGEAQHYIDMVSPASHVNLDTVPTILAYGLKDKVVPPALKYLLLDALEENGVTYDYIEFPNSGHGLLNDPDKMAEYVAVLDTYIERYFENFKEKST